MRHTNRRNLARLQASPKRALPPSTKQSARSFGQRRPLEIPYPHQCRCISARQPPIAESRKPSLSQRDAKPQVLQRRPAPKTDSHVPYFPIKSRTGEEETARESECSDPRRCAGHRRDRLQFHLQGNGRGGKGRRVPIESRVMHCGYDTCEGFISKEAFMFYMIRKLR